MSPKAIRVTVAVVAVLVAVATVSYRGAYGSWWQAPERIAYCGRTYLPAATQLTLADVRSRESQTALPGDKPYPVVPVGHVPPVVGAQMLAAVTPPEERQKLGVPCAMVVYLKTGEDAYSSYSLSGGP